MKSVAVIGPGRLGLALARLLCDAGYTLQAVVSRDADRALTSARFAGVPAAATTDPARVKGAQIVFITVPDDQIGETAAALRRDGYLDPGTVLIHCSGILTASMMHGEGEPSIRTLSLHPLQTFADAVIGMGAIPGSPFAIEGDREALALGEKIVEDLGGIPFRIESGQKALYHAAACIASNYMVTLVSLSCRLLEASGFDGKDSFRLLAPLLKGTGKNLSALGPELALTGPIARGDARTVSKHLRALEDQPGEFGELYRLLGLQTVDLASGARRISDEKAETLRLLLQPDADPET